MNYAKGELAPIPLPWIHHWCMYLSTTITHINNSWVLQIIVYKLRYDSCTATSGTTATAARARTVPSLHAVIQPITKNSSKLEGYRQAIHVKRIQQSAVINNTHKLYNVARFLNRSNKASLVDLTTGIPGQHFSAQPSSAQAFCMHSTWVKIYDLCETILVSCTYLSQPTEQMVKL